MKTNIIQNPPATRADTIAEIGKALTTVIDSMESDTTSATIGKLTVILEAVIKAELLTRKDQEKAIAAAESLWEGAETLQGLLDYISTEEHPPRDLFEVLKMIRGSIQGATTPPDSGEEEPRCTDGFGPIGKDPDPRGYHPADTITDNPESHPDVMTPDEWDDYDPSPIY